MGYQAPLMNIGLNKHADTTKRNITLIQAEFHAGKEASHAWRSILRDKLKPVGKIEEDINKEKWIELFDKFCE